MPRQEESFLIKVRSILSSERPFVELLRLAREKIARLLGVERTDGNPFAVKLAEYGLIPYREPEQFVPTKGIIGRIVERAEWEKNQQKRSETLEDRFHAHGGWGLEHQVSERYLVGEEKTRISKEIDQTIEFYQAYYPWKTKSELEKTKQQHVKTQPIDNTNSQWEQWAYEYYLMEGVSPVQARDKARENNLLNGFSPVEREQYRDLISQGVDPLDAEIMVQTESKLSGFEPVSRDQVLDRIQARARKKQTQPAPTHTPKPRRGMSL